MRRNIVVGLIIAPMMALTLILAGCGGQGDVVKKVKPRTEGKVEAKKEEKGLEMVAIEPKDGYGSVKGTVTLDGDVAMEPQPFDNNPDKNICMAGSEWEKLKQTWLWNKENKGVANVVIFLKASEGKYFKLKPEDMARTDVVEVHQPHCAFVPHVSVIFPEYYDPATKGMKSSGQAFKIINDAPMNHNTGVVPNDESINSKASFTLSKGDVKEFKGSSALKPDFAGPQGLKCDIHPWMNAKVWVLDHPYAAVTDKDGKFEIKNVPLGVKVHVVGWHEGGGYFYGGQGGTENTFDGKTDLKLTLKAK